MPENALLDDLVTSTLMSRRTFHKWSAALGAAAMLGAHELAADVTPADASRDAVPVADKVVWQSCMVNCGSRCPLRLHVKDGVVVRVETDNTGDDEFGMHQVRACVRGRSVRQRIYNPDRLKYPMRRVG
ncbi:MAG: twin-arginine translocation signal domain-containing protein, partial [Anaerolineae bacterium]|nr:twin-arginine translocation signal domain-containing protein [Anaerolineae bacterium]